MNATVATQTMTYACHSNRHENCKGHGFDGLAAVIEKRPTPCNCSCHATLTTSAPAVREP